jgi:hypothetical protein
VPITVSTIENSPHKQAARQALADASKPPFSVKQYSLVARQASKMFHRHGLGQTLAYLQLRSSGRTDSPYDLLARQIDRWVLAALAVSAPSTLAALSSRDSRFYLEASEQAWLFLNAVGDSLKEAP